MTDHGKFLRDGEPNEIKERVKWICEYAVELGAPMALGLAAVPLGTDLSKINLILNTIDEFGVYK